MYFGQVCKVHLVRLDRQRLARSTLKMSRLFSFSLIAVTTIKLSTTLAEHDD